MSHDEEIIVEQTINHSCTWIMNKFCLKDYSMFSYRSPKFKTGINNENEWYLCISRFTSSLVLNISLEDCSLEEIAISFEVSIQEGTKRLEKKTDSIILRKGCSESISFDLCKELSTNIYFMNSTEKLIISCKIIDINGIGNMKEKMNCLTNDLKLFMQDEKFSDVTLSVEGKLFFAHKSILIARSPVFRAMFENKMKESIENRIEIADISYEVMQQVLHFIYTDDVENMKDLASGILAAAEKYELAYLKIMCLEALFQNLTNDNALETLILTDLYRADDLKNKALNYIVSHLKELDLNSLSSHPHLFKEILIYCQKMDKPLMS